MLYRVLKIKFSFSKCWKQLVWKTKCKAFLPSWVMNYFSLCWFFSVFAEKKFLETLMTEAGKGWPGIVILPTLPPRPIVNFPPPIMAAKLVPGRQHLARPQLEPHLFCLTTLDQSCKNFMEPSCLWQYFNKIKSVMETETRLQQNNYRKQNPNTREINHSLGSNYIYIIMNVWQMCEK